MDRAAETMRCKLRQKGKDNRNMARENILQGINIIACSCRYQESSRWMWWPWCWSRASVSITDDSCLLPCEPRHHLHHTRPAPSSDSKATTRPGWWDNHGVSERWQNDRWSFERQNQAAFVAHTRVTCAFVRRYLISVETESAARKYVCKLTRRPLDPCMLRYED